MWLRKIAIDLLYPLYIIIRLYESLIIVSKSIQFMGSRKSRKKAVKPVVTSSDYLSDYGILLSVAIIIAAGIFAYSNSFQVPFLFDDLANILDNPTIRSLRNIGQVLSPLTGSGVGDRPFINFTLAVNYAVSGEKVWSYHALNLFVHIMAALTLFGIVRRTLSSGRMKKEFDRMAVPLALGSALIWMLHPLQTQAVTYVIQRCESLMGLFFLLTLYCAIRSWSSASANVWHLLSVLSFLFGMSSKEVSVMAPFVVFAYERTFSHFLMKDIWKYSRLLYAGYGVVFMGYFMLVYTGSATSTGLGSASSAPWVYWWTQPEIILHYLRLAVWPDSLCFDYGWPLASFRDALPSVFIVIAGMAISGWLFFKRKPAGFLAGSFFLVLLPTSAMPLLDPAANHRMYLSLAALSVAFVAGGYHWVSYLFRRFTGMGKGAGLNAVCIMTLALIVVSSGILTYQRNQVYRETLTLWEDTVRKAPQNARAYLNCGVALEQAGKPYDAIRRFQEAIRLRPDYAEAYSNMGNVLTGLGRPDEAVVFFRKAVSLQPKSTVAYMNMGIALTRLGKKEEAIRVLREAIRLKPDYTEAYSNLGVALGMSGRLPEAVDVFMNALNLKPDSSDLHSNLGLALGRMGKREEAIAHFQEALRLNPDNRAARMNLEIIMKMRRRNFNPENRQ